MSLDINLRKYDIHSIRECLELTAQNLGLSYSVVYNQLFSQSEGIIPPAPLYNFLKDRCGNIPTDEDSRDSREIEIKGSRELYNCVLYGNSYVPNIVPDYDLLNEDPDLYLTETNPLKLKDMERLYELANFLYYNTGGGGGLTDNAFDAIEYHLRKKLKAKKRRLDKIGALPVERLRAELPVGMPSLDKVKPGTRELDKFLNKKSLEGTDLIYSVKLDGVSGLVTYINGNIHKIYTRGNGNIGGDISFVKDYISSIPDSLEDTDLDGFDFVAIRGEFVISKDVWMSTYKDHYATARNFVAGKLNSAHVDPGLVDIDFVGYDIVSLEGDRYTIVDSLELLGGSGFLVAEWGLLSDRLTFTIASTYKKLRENYKYYIDGLVLAYNIDDREPDSTGEVINPDYAVAFKMQLEKQIRETKVLRIEWNPSRYGKIIPKVIYEAVYFEGRRVTKATGVNYRNIQNKKLGKGAKVEVVLSGDIIPQIRQVLSPTDIPFKKVVPKKDFQGGWHYPGSGPHAFLNDINNNKVVQLKRISHFFTVIEVPGLKEGTAKKLVDFGYTTVKDVIDVKDFTHIKGIGAKKSDDLVINISDRLTKVPINRFMIASSTLEENIGKGVMKILVRDHISLFKRNITSAKIREYLNMNKIPGVGAKTVPKLIKGIPGFVKWLVNLIGKKKYKELFNYSRVLSITPPDPEIKGKLFATTGFMGDVPYDIDDFIWYNRGEMKSSVKTKSYVVDYIIVGESVAFTEKTLEAMRLGIEVFNVYEFRERFMS